MKANLNLGRLAGVKIIVHWTFYLLLLWIALEGLWQGEPIKGVFFNLFLIIVLFGCVILHELGHALMAKRLKVEVIKITLLPIGGMSHFESIPDNPKDELLISITGPMVNLMIAIILYLILPYFTAKDYPVLMQALNAYTFDTFLVYLLLANIALFVFNLVPAFPMDGGRILRATLSTFMDRTKATQLAVNIGNVIAVILLLIGLLYNPILVFIALFILLSAYGENQYIQHTEILKDHSIKEAMLTDITVFSPQDEFGKVIDVLLAGSEINFLVVDDNELIGVLYRDDIIKNADNRNLKIKDINLRPYKTVSINSKLVDVYAMMRKEKNPFFPVLQDGKAVGVIDIYNLNEFIMINTHALA